jgi:hypothetical protein
VENKDPREIVQKNLTKTTKLKREASMLRFEELELFKKEKEEILQSEKIRIIEKHLYL